MKKGYFTHLQVLNYKNCLQGTYKILVIFAKFKWTF